MKVAVALFAVLALARGAAIYPATHLIRTPQFDSAVIKSDRLGGNFAYSSVEAPAYAAVSPVVQNVLSPVGVSYAATPLQYPAFSAYPAYPAYPAVLPGLVASAPVAPVAPIYPGAAPVIPVAPVAPVSAVDPAATPIEDSAAPIAEAPSVHQAPSVPQAPLADAIESSASSDDSVTIEAA